MKPGLIGLATAAVALSLGAGACGSAKGNAVASLSGHTSTTAAASHDRAASKKEFEDAMLDYAKCMREHGVDMPDPTFSDTGGGKGMFTVGAPGGAGPGKDSTAFTNADKACKPILDKAQQDMPQPTPEEEAKMRDNALAFARCMRDHGVDMPDPTFDDQGRAQIEIKKPAGGDDKSNTVAGGGGSERVTVSPKDDPAFKAAMDACSSKDGGPGLVTSGAK